MENYNEENMMLINQNTSPKRDNLSQEDLKEVIMLIEQIGPKMFANLLLSFGLGKKEKESEEDNE